VTVLAKLFFGKSYPNKAADLSVI